MVFLLLLALGLLGPRRLRVLSVVLTTASAGGGGMVASALPLPRRFGAGDSLGLLASFTSVEVRFWLAIGV